MAIGVAVRGRLHATLVDRGCPEAGGSHDRADEDDRSEYGAVYLRGAATTTSTAAVTVDAQQVGDPAWTRSGIMVRNDMGDTSSAGLIDLAVTPGNG